MTSDQTTPGKISLTPWPTAPPADAISQRWTCRTPSLLMSAAAFVWALALVFLPQAARGQAGGPPAVVTVSSASATGVALSAAAQYRVNHDQQWKDYEDVVIIGALNEITKVAANTGRMLGGGDYNRYATEMRDWLDANSPPAQNFLAQDPSARLRFTIDC
jgi:hypothetical protein